MSKESEAQTRNRRIDPKLESQGWGVVPLRQFSDDDATTAVEEYPTDEGPADYLLADAGEKLGVVEAKKLTVGPQGVLTQAQRYSRGIDAGTRYQGEYGVPFLYSTNGEEIWYQDVRHELNRSRQVAAFHTPKAPVSYTHLTLPTNREV